ncbi:MAG TPA: chemoreceptor glutamine deamidase CheD, partial [Trinickia sp.]|nr:chemoreceptor glutamine deamidase CheD [Trinickia sp.]
EARAARHARAREKQHAELFTPPGANGAAKPRIELFGAKATPRIESFGEGPRGSGTNDSAKTVEEA